MKCLKSENNVLMVRAAKGEGVKHGLLAFYGEKEIQNPHETNRERGKIQYTCKLTASNPRT